MKKILSAFLLVAAATSCGTTPSPTLSNENTVKEETKLTAQYTPVYSYRPGSCTRSSWRTSCTFAPDGGYVNLKSVIIRCGDDEFGGMCDPHAVGAYVQIITIDRWTGLEQKVIPCHLNVWSRCESNLPSNRVVRVVVSPYGGNGDTAYFRIE